MKTLTSLHRSVIIIVSFFILISQSSLTYAINLEIKNKQDWSAPTQRTHWQTYGSNKSTTKKELSPEEKKAQAQWKKEKKDILKKVNKSVKKYKNKSIKKVRTYLKSIDAFSYLSNDEIDKYLQDIYPKEKLTPSKVKKKDSKGNKLWWPYVYSPKIYKIVVHHTGDEIKDDNLLTSTDHQKIDWETKVQNIFKYHAYTQKWGDIGYHYLIDPLGNVYEGRGNGDEKVIGGHSYLSNTGTVGIAIIGNYENQPLPKKAKTALTKLIAKIADEHHLSLTKKSKFHGINSYNIIGHRDLGATACPGKKIYSQLSSVRKAAAKLVPSSNKKSSKTKSSSIGKYKPYIPGQSNKYLKETDFQYKILTNYVNIKNDPNQRQKIKIAIKNSSVLNIDKKDIYIKVDNNSDYLKDLSTKVYLRKDLPHLGQSDFNLYASTNQKLGTSGFYIQVYYKDKKIGDKHFITVKINKNNEQDDSTNQTTTIITPQTTTLKENNDTKKPEEEEEEEINNDDTIDLAQPDEVSTPTVFIGNSDGVAINKVSLDKNVRVKISRFNETEAKIKLHGHYQVINSQGKIISQAEDKTLNFYLDNNQLNFTCPTKNDKCAKYNTDSKHFKLKAINRVFAYTEITNYANRPSWNTRINDNLFRESLYLVNNNGVIEIVNELSLMNYLKGVAEVNNSDPEEKLKTMALLVKNYTLYYLSPLKQKFPDKFYDLDDSPDRCQKYLGYGFEKRASNWISALEKTFSQVITYNNKLIKTPYFSQSDGFTKSAQAVWGWTNTPYLASVADKYCNKNVQLGHGVGLS